MCRVITWLGFAALAAAQQIDSQAFVAKYCAGCHNEKLKSGNFSWAKVDPAHPDQNAAEAERAIHMLEVGMMPPPGMPRPDAGSIHAFADGLAARIDQAAAAHP